MTVHSIITAPLSSAQLLVWNDGPLITPPSAQGAEHETQGLLLEEPRANDGPEMMHRVPTHTQLIIRIIASGIGATAQGKETATKEMPFLPKQALN